MSSDPSPHARLDLGAEAAGRLAALRGRGCEVVGPTPAEDTSRGTPPEGEGAEDQWSVAVHVPRPNGEPEVVTGHGAGPDQAALSAAALAEAALADGSA